MDETLKRIGRNMKVERARRGWTQAELAERAGLNKHSINHYEQGRIVMKVDTLVKIAGAFDVTIEELVHQDS